MRVEVPRRELLVETSAWRRWERKRIKAAFAVTRNSQLPNCESPLKLSSLRHTESSVSCTISLASVSLRMKRKASR